MNIFWRHFKRTFFRGIIVLIPAGLTVFIIFFLYSLIDEHIVKHIDRLLDVSIPGIGFVILIAFLYLFGLVTGNFIGRWVVGRIEKLLGKIPIVKVTYKLGKQVADSLSLSKEEVFKKAVLVEAFRKDSWVIGFVTGEVDSPSDQEKIIKIYVPTALNPTAGFLVMVKESEVSDPGITVEEAIKMIISGGIISPEKLQVGK